MVIISLLIIVGLVLVLAEILFIPGIFLTGLLGVGCMAYSCYLGFSFYGITGGSVTIVINSVLLLVCLVYALRAKTWKKVSLATKIESKALDNPEEKGIAAGMEAVTATRLNPMGKIRINGAYAEATAEKGFIDENSTVVVTEVIDNKIFVKLK